MEALSGQLVGCLGVKRGAVCAAVSGVRFWKVLQRMVVKCASSTHLRQVFIIMSISCEQ